MKRFIAVVAVVLLFASVGWADSGYITSSGLSLKKLVEISKLMEITVFDHLIIAENKYTSFVEKRMI